MPAPEEVKKAEVLRPVCRHGGAGQDLEGMAVTSGKPAYRRRMRLRWLGFDVRNAGMPAPDEILILKEAMTGVRNAGMPVPDEIKKTKLLLPACRHAGAGQKREDMATAGLSKSSQASGRFIR